MALDVDDCLPRDYVWSGNGQCGCEPLLEHSHAASHSLGQSMMMLSIVILTALHVGSTLSIVLACVASSVLSCILI